mmetsp:Transcript_113761/g.332250  ORF Transcript_113761/g.332250 Transcript_113761/m.332250 type:complete len:97 (+) Transcript_113761:6-296(+)
MQLFRLLLSGNQDAVAHASPSMLRRCLVHHLTVHSTRAMMGPSRMAGQSLWCEFPATQLLQTRDRPVLEEGQGTANRTFLHQQEKYGGADDESMWV